MGRVTCTRGLIGSRKVKLFQGVNPCRRYALARVAKRGEPCARHPPPPPPPIVAPFRSLVTFFSFYFSDIRVILPAFVDRIETPLPLPPRLSLSLSPYFPPTFRRCRIFALEVRSSLRPRVERTTRRASPDAVIVERWSSVQTLTGRRFFAAC